MAEQTLIGEPQERTTAPWPINRVAVLDRIALQAQRFNTSEITFVQFKRDVDLCIEWLENLDHGGRHCRDALFQHVKDRTGEGPQPGVNE